MSDEYGGPERRAPNCAAHEKNTTDLARIKGGLTLASCLIGLAIWLLSGYMGSVSTKIDKVVVGVEAMNVKMTEITVSSAVTRVEVEQLKKDVAELQRQLNKGDRP